LTEVPKIALDTAFAVGAAQYVAVKIDGEKRVRPEFHRVDPLERVGESLLECRSVGGQAHVFGRRTFRTVQVRLLRQVEEIAPWLIQALGHSQRVPDDLVVVELLEDSVGGQRVEEDFIRRGLKKR
jgi:hypothetical protein